MYNVRNMIILRWSPWILMTKKLQSGTGQLYLPRKTESSKELVASIADGHVQVLRLDPDDLRIEFEDYDGSNSYLFQRAVVTLVERYQATM